MNKRQSTGAKNIKNYTPCIKKFDLPQGIPTNKNPLLLKTDKVLICNIKSKFNSIFESTTMGNARRHLHGVTEASNRKQLNQHIN